MAKTNTYWFRPKTYGYGFFPVSWEGWLMTLMFLGVLLKLAEIHGLTTFAAQPTGEEIFSFVWHAFVTATAFTFFAEKKMKGNLAWRWGKKSLLKSLKKLFK